MATESSHNLCRVSFRENKRGGHNQASDAKRIFDSTDLTSSLPGDGDVACHREDNVITNSVITDPGHVVQMKEIAPRRFHTGTFQGPDTKKVMIRMLSVTVIFAYPRLIPKALFMVPRILGKVGQTSTSQY
jgi:hypothetical protein